MTECNHPGCSGQVMATGFCEQCGHRPLTAPPSTPFTVRPGGDGLLDLPFITISDPEELVDPDPQPPHYGYSCRRRGCQGTVGAAYRGEPAIDHGYCPDCREPFDYRAKLKPGDSIEHYEVKGVLANGGLGWVYLAQDTNISEERHFVALKGLLDSHDEVALAQAVRERRYLTRLSHPNIVRIVTHLSHPAPDGKGLTGYIVMEFVGGLSLRQVMDLFKKDSRVGHDGGGDGSGGGSEGSSGARAGLDGDGKNGARAGLDGNGKNGARAGLDGDGKNGVRGGRLSKDGGLGREDGNGGSNGNPFHTPRVYEHILSYGHHILQALDHLHNMGLTHSDIKPDNVMHYQTHLKLIDLGAVHPIGNTEGQVFGTAAYAAPEVRITGRPTAGTDLHTVGVTLRKMLAATDQPLPGLGRMSIERLHRRACATPPARPFSGAAEMDVQLRGVLREVGALLRRDQDYPEPSVLFALPTELLDAGLGSVPPLQRWLGHRSHHDFTFGRPDPATAAAGLPVPSPHPGTHGKAEFHYRDCLAHLRRGEIDAMGDALDSAERELSDSSPHGPCEPYDWRLAWHRGLLALARHDPQAAQRHFDAVYSELPGEYAPKLAIGYCAECLGDHDRAKMYYEAVWRRNRAQGSAAFGLARLELAAGRRAAAIEILESVRQDSLHSEQARIAAVRARLVRLPGADGEPGPADLLAAVQAFQGHELRLDEGAADGPAHERLATEIREAALRRLGHRTGNAEAMAGTAELSGRLLGSPVTERGLCELLSDSYRGLARHARSARAVEHLVDLANRTRPFTTF